MKLLLDTHTFLWWILNDRRLIGTAKGHLINPGNDLYLSAAAYWEIAVKVAAGKYQLPGPFEAFLQKHMTANAIQVFPIELSHAAAVAVLPLHHRDPFDRIIIAQAIVEGMSVVSADPAFDAYPVTRLW